ncbi:hypothetical protein G7074_07140 [Pedobacter sp. HDW13]|uniref:hypothetical protein n=1 Tax=Pedobacter sp. HDW13 TaxID=2714940 RepID=UPI001408C4A0|nr:hypothetical protein [Pedobacter sp. HDW13]QIL39076.1 hypothetical protein G7074_07140 [Pedobacter sp. HDW13]
METEILKAFKIYKRIVFTADTDLSFWKSFLERAIDEYCIKNPNNIELFTSVFCAYNFNLDKNEGYLKSSDNIRLIEKNNLKKCGDDFFSSISLLLILKNYVAIETFILQAIHIKYFYLQGSLLGNRKAASRINNEIKAYLKEINIKSDNKNNRHIIEFLKSKSTSISSFLSSKIRVDLDTSWGNFFEIISILRNIIAHQDQVVTSDTINEIKSKGKILFKNHFITKKKEVDKANFTLNIKNTSNFLAFFNDFSLNIVKLMFEEKDLKFLGMN